VANEVVAHYLDGRVVKGISHDIDPARPTCHIRTPDRQSIEVKLADLKALFFVKSLAGDPTYTEGSTVEAGDQRARGAYRIEVPVCRRRAGRGHDGALPARAPVLLRGPGRWAEQ
jgi:hypothetical protein